MNLQTLQKAATAVAACLALLITSRPATADAQTNTNVFGGGTNIYTVSSSTTWSNIVVVEANVTVQAGATLTISPGTEVRVTNGLSITAQAGAAIVVDGSADSPVLVTSANGTSTWGNIAATGAGSSVTVRHAEIARGGINLASGATALIEDVYVHDVFSAIVGNSASSVTVRRVHVKNFSETIYNSTLALVEDSLFEDQTAASSDALEYQSAPRGCEVRRCTFRNSTGDNSDAFDCNGSSFVFIHDCVIHDFSDKGISFGASGAGGAPDYGMIVSNCLIYRVNTGIALKDGSTATLVNNTISDSPFGFRWYQKFQNGGGHGTNTYNNIVWNNQTNIALLNGATLTASYSDIGGTNYPGVGNISADPLFVSAATGDYRLQPASPCRATGSNGLDMGILLPVGGVPPVPPGLIALDVGWSVSIRWGPAMETYGFIYGYVLERATNGGSFVPVPGGNLLLAPGHVGTNYFDTNVIAGGTYLYRVRATNWIGSSPFSEPITIALSADHDSDGIPDAWETAHQLDPANPLDASADPDQDGLTNLQEYLAGTDPRDPSSTLILAASASTTNALIRFSAADNKSYTVEYRNAFSTNSTWQHLLDIPAGTARSVTITNPVTQPARFYRARTP